MSIKTQTRYHGSVSLERGPLVYSLKIEEEWRQIGGELPHADWEVHPRSPWNYALELNREHPEASCRLASRPVGEMPFSPEGAPVFMKVKGRRVPAWTIEHNAAGPIPQSPVISTEPLEELTLIPYGCTNLRVTEFPTLQLFSSQGSAHYTIKPLLVATGQRDSSHHAVPLLMQESVSPGRTTWCYQLPTGSQQECTPWDCSPS